MNRIPSISPYPSQSFSQNAASQGPLAVGPPLFEEQSANSMTNTLLAPVNELQSLTQALFQSLSSTQARPSQPPPISSFLAVDAALAQATQLARKHQVKQRKIERLKNDVLEMELKWREIVRELEEGKQDLNAIIVEGEERIKSIEAAKAGEYRQITLVIPALKQRTYLKASIPYPELLASAQSLSAFTSAPPNMPDQTLPGQPPPPLFFPPFPNEEKMRKGHMNNEAPLGPLGETHSVGKREYSGSPIASKSLCSYLCLAPTVQPPKSPDLPHHIGGPGANPYRPDHRPTQLQMFDLDLDLNPDL